MGVMNGNLRVVFFFNVSLSLLNSWFSIWVQFVPFQICTPDKNRVT